MPMMTWSPPEFYGTQRKQRSGEQSTESCHQKPEPRCDHGEFCCVEGADHPEKCAEEHHPFDTDIQHTGALRDNLA